LTIPHAFSRKVEFVESKGPILEALKTEAEIKALHFDIERVGKVFEALRLTKQEMQKSYQGKSLIGFAGSPWTIACYMVEGKSSKDFEVVRAFAYEHHDLFKILIDKITEATKSYLKEQVRAGADIIKLFDSWAGVLTPDQFRKWVIDPTREIVSSLKSEFPDLKIIGFPRKAGLMYEEYSIKTGVDCTALDQNVDMKLIRNLIPDRVLQGNLDNLLLAHSNSMLYDRVAEIVEANKGKSFIFNLGHGVLPHTPIENVTELVRIVRSL
jgi:uroporphyrinogen decarboxylase